MNVTIIDRDLNIVNGDANITDVDLPIGRVKLYLVDIKWHLELVPLPHNELRNAVGAERVATLVVDGADTGKTTNTKHKESGSLTEPTTFIGENAVAANAFLQGHSRRVQHRSRLSGLDFFSALPDSLEAVLDPAIFATLPRIQQRLFRTTAVLLTGAVLGGGSERCIRW